MIAWAFLVANVVLLVRAQEVQNDIVEIELRIPNEKPDVNDLYMCTYVPLMDDRTGGLIDTTYVTGYTPHGSMKTAHHMLIYGCGEPGTPDLMETVTWDCGEMHAGGSKSKFPPGKVCGQGTSKIMYAWAKDAPALDLPEGVGFKIGAGTDIKYLVLQVHYMNKLDKNDTSGVTLSVTQDEMPKEAGVLLLGTGGEMPPHQVTNLDVDCQINEDVELHPFAFRTHTHKLGTKVVGYRIRDGKWDLIGEHNPQEPQMFYPSNDVVVKGGDQVAARCVMDNKGDEAIYTGATGADEMCNFYMMYWVEGENLSESMCFSPGPPAYSWAQAGLNSPLDA